METYCLYTHASDFDAVLQKITQAFPQSTPQLSEEEERKIVVIQKKGGLFSKSETLKLSYRVKQEPTYNLKNGDCPVSNQMRGMYNFIASLPTQNEQLRGLLLRKIETINAEIIIQCDPTLTSTLSKLLHELTLSLDAFVFMQPGQTISRSAVQHFTDENFNLIIDIAGNTGNGKPNVEIESRYFDRYEASPEQLARKEKSERFLVSKGIAINTHLPLVESVDELVLRNEKDIVGRIYALLVMAARGENVPATQLEEMIADLAIDSFTEDEKALYEKPELTDRDRAKMTWRYESLNVLLWALGFVDELIYPSEVCNVQHIIDTVMSQPRWKFESAAVLRDKATILDQLDLIYRMHWAVVDARYRNTPPPPEIHSGIVYERHYALNWLTVYSDQEWDDVTTDT